ncbi:Wzz/FepE/Etk N-terminal domain-containing protein [Bacillus sp. B190/17]|uniref:Wzz/FepE/Etk N-terminal domain-containing protein n=1 Tax=Bacillus lumedeiriae TaxID=3058829 RepID=A0ABW8I9U7_9BACI
MEEKVSLRELIGTLRKHLKLMLFITFMAALTSGIISYFVLTPVYQASTQLLINQANAEKQIYSPVEVQANLQLINTYNVIIKSPVILEKAVGHLKLDLTAEQLNDKITVQSEQDSQVVNVFVRDTNPKRAASIANEVAAVFQTEIVKIMNVDNVSILAKANVPEKKKPVKPRPLLNIAITIMLGLMTGAGAAFLREYLDNTIKDEQDVERLLDLPMLGSVAVITVKEGASTGLEENKTAFGGETIGS